MINSIIDQLVLPTLDPKFFDLIGGVAKPMKINTGGKVKTIPAARVINNINNLDGCLTDDYIPLVPSDKYRSILYFEEIGTGLGNPSSIGRVAFSDVRVIWWYNTGRFVNPKAMQVVWLKTIIARSYAGNIVDQSIVSPIASVTKYNSNTADLFSKYSYDEAETQFLTFPYEVISFDMKFKYVIPSGCFNEPTTNDDLLC